MINAQEGLQFSFTTTMDNKEAIKKLKEQQAEFNENYVDFAGVNAAYDLAIKALEEKEADMWIPVSEKLPEESLNSVIGWDAYRERCVFVQYIDGHFQITGNDESFHIIAWRPLPEPYKENDK